MKIYDITVPISEGLPIYEGDPKVLISVASSIAEGAPANVSKMCFGVHSGSHVDAPNHFIEGARRVDALDLDKLIGPCRVVEIDHNAPSIGPEHLEPARGAERVLFKTRNSTFWNSGSKAFRTDFTYIEPEAARLLAAVPVKLVGIDYLSVEKFGSVDFAVHHTLLEKEIVILEGIDLNDVPAGEYELICLPMKYRGGTGDGAPARCILRQL